LEGGDNHLLHKRTVISSSERRKGGEGVRLVTKKTKQDLEIPPNNQWSRKKGQEITKKTHTRNTRKGKEKKEKATSQKKGRKLDNRRQMKVHLDMKKMRAAGTEKCDQNGWANIIKI